MVNGHEDWRYLAIPISHIPQDRSITLLYNPSSEFQSEVISRLIRVIARFDDSKFGITKKNHPIVHNFSIFQVLQSSNFIQQILSIQRNHPLHFFSSEIPTFQTCRSPSPLIHKLLNKSRASAHESPSM